MANDKLTTAAKKIGDYFAKQFKDKDNELYKEVSDVVIDEFIENIKKDNPVLASWIEDYRTNHKKTTITNTSTGSCSYSSSGCGYTPKRSSYSGGGCGVTNGRC